MTPTCFDACAVCGVVVFHPAVLCHGCGLPAKAIGLAAGQSMAALSKRYLEYRTLAARELVRCPTLLSAAQASFRIGGHAAVRTLLTERLVRCAGRDLLSEDGGP